MSTIIIASFSSDRELQAALATARGATVGAIDSHAPAPSREAPASSRLSWAILFAGVLGFVGMYLLEIYADTASYPLDIGGRPNFSWPSLVPIAFEVGVLCAVATGFFGYLLLSRLPRPYDPIDEADTIREASRSRWLLVIRPGDESAAQRARALIRTLPAIDYEELPR